MARDHRDVRDAQREERLVHLHRRRQGGAPLEGGRSEKHTSISSDSGLVETETILPAAVTATTIVEDIGSITSTGTPDNDYSLLIETNILGRGYPVSIHFTDHYQWSAGGANGSISYRLRVVDPSDAVVASNEQFTNESNAFGWNTWSYPDVTVFADLQDGVVYRAQVHIFRAAFAWTSLLRRFVITDLKR